ncbi:uncharacterized protein B0H18DRAFT_118441 [Fomitopsis serialis]|uniref:uncharacterized protein n=1 Tax=Fomitopsis serialis TaxID=139415 RepID=UPI0020073717|nr:uncharacterized protein B0H18DRAFT_118441 [Neoantrodia serialis]KAH9930906.1 hypothetical protein B0H18DRAFT_118441 [Neoantrodia serialis]
MHFLALLFLGVLALYAAVPSLAVSARARIAHDRLRKYAAHPDYGVPQHKIDAVARKRALSPRQDAADPRDLVARLIQDNQDIWQQLLSNPFIEAMKTAAPGNESITAGYQWYEVDYWYCIRLLAFDVERSFSAQSLAELNSSLSDVANDGAYALSSVQVTTAPPPAGLGLSESVVLSAAPTAALNQYTDFQFVAAKDYNWVVSLAAQIPCIQSYYYIAEGLVNTSFSDDTLWYEQWVLPNLDYSYLQPQIGEWARP